MAYEEEHRNCRLQSCTASTSVGTLSYERLAVAFLDRPCPRRSFRTLSASRSPWCCCLANASLRVSEMYSGPTERKARAPPTMADPELPIEACPLCLEGIDEDDRSFRPCPCGYQVRADPSPSAAFNLFSPKSRGRSRACLCVCAHTPDLRLLLQKARGRRPIPVPCVPPAVQQGRHPLQPAHRRRVRPGPVGEMYTIGCITDHTCPPRPLAGSGPPIRIAARQQAARERRERERKENVDPSRRRALEGVRVVQRHVLYVAGLPAKLTDERVRTRCRAGAHGPCTARPVAAPFWPFLVPFLALSRPFPGPFSSLS